MADEFNESAVFKPWELRLFGKVINSDYVSVGLAEKVENTTKLRWPRLRVAAILTGEASVLRSVAAVLIADKLGIEYDDALGKIDGLTYAELDAAVVLVDDDKPTGYEDGFPPSAGEDSITS
jgi:hypothetical protein